MVLTSAPGFKRSLHTSTVERQQLCPLPFQLEATVSGSSRAYQMDLELPRTGALAGAELTRIGLDSNDIIEKACGDVSVFLQLLDGQGRASGHPFAVLAHSCTSPLRDGKIRVPLQNGQKVRVLLLADENSTPSVVRFSGVFIPSQGDFLLGNPRVAAKIASFVAGPWLFVPDAGRHRPGPSERKRPRCVEAHTQKRDAESSNDSEPPHLVYAQVAGGEDES